jgi:Ca2+-binding RTX toxin-like protein
LASPAPENPDDARIEQMRAYVVPVALGALVLYVGVPAYTASNIVPATNAGSSSTPITANTLKPSACSGITLTNLVVGAVGTSANDLILGTSAGDFMSGGAGNDCMLGGGGNDIMDGGLGTDVCLGGPGTDTMNCETAIQ